MNKRLLAISSILLLTSLVIAPAGATSGSAIVAPSTTGLSANESLADQDYQAQPNMEDIGSASDPYGLGSISMDGAMGQLYPDDMDPITMCQASLGGPFGEDAEIFMGGDVGYWVDLIPEWIAGTPITNPLSISDISAMAAGSENIAAVWKGANQSLQFGLWQTSETNPAGTWARIEDLGLQADGNPTIIAKSELQWEVFARQNGSIYTSILTDTLGANRVNSSAWVPIEGVNNATSDPVVMAVNPNHTGIFYLDAAGLVWFTEWTGGWEWRDEPIPLVDSWLSFLPLVVGTQSGVGGSPDATIAPSSGSGVLSGPRNFQVLSAVSRNENHMAVFAVNADNQLWVREWTIRDRDDWSNTHWVLLMEGVALEKPGVASRHFDHIGVAVRDTLGNPNYIEWTLETGWLSPTPIPGPSSGDVTSRLTLAAVTMDAYWLFAIDQSSQIQQIIWNQDTGWGDWGAIDAGYDPDQVLAAPVRRFMDVMVLGRTPAGGIDNIHFTSQGGAVTSTVMVPQRSSAYLPGGQVMAWVNGSVVHVAARQSELDPPYFWQVDAREMVDTDPLTATLLLTNHDFAEYPEIRMAAGDLDFDGNDEVVIATSNSGQIGVAFSVLDFDLDSFLVISTVAYSLIPEEVIRAVAIGDLDGNGKQDEIFLISSLSTGHVYRYLPVTQQIEEIFQGDLGSLFRFDVAIGRLYPRDPDNADPSQQYLGEQVIVLDSDSSYDNHNTVFIFTMITDAWDLVAVDTFLLAECAECFSSRPAVAAGDMNGDGFDEIAAWHGKVISYVEPRSGLVETENYDPSHAIGDELLSVGDIDLDGRAEILAGGQRYLGIYETMGDDRLARTKWQQWDPSWGTATAVLAADLDHDTFVSQLVGCKTFQEARVAVVVNGAPRWYANGVPIQNASGSFSLSKGGGYSDETGTSHSFGTTVEIGFDSSALPIIEFYGSSLRYSVISDYLRNVGQYTTQETELIYGTDYTFDDKSLGQVILNVRTYTCNYYDLYSPEQPGSASRAMVCNPAQHEKRFHSLDTWLEMGNQGEFGDSWADVGHRSPSGVHTNNLEEPRNYAGSLPYDYRVVYNWEGSDIPLICGDQFPQSVVWWAEDADGYSQGTEFSIEENTSLSVGSSELGFTFDYSFSFGDGINESETFAWMQTVGFSGGVTQFYDDPSDPGDDRPCYKVVPYVYQARAQTLGGFTYPYLELDYYVLCIGCGGTQMFTDGLDAILPP